MPVIINRRGELVLVDRPNSHFLPSVPTPPSQHHVVRRTIYRRRSANAIMTSAHNQAQNHAHPGALSGMLDNNAFQNGYVVITTRRFSLPASMTHLHAGHGGDPIHVYAGANPVFTPRGQFHEAMHLNANAITQANRAHSTFPLDIRTSTLPFDAAHAPAAELLTSRPSSTNSPPLQQPKGHRSIEEAPPVLPSLSMDKLRELMAKSNSSMKNLEEFDRRHGLRLWDAQNMVKTARSRKQLLENNILSKWDGSPLIAFQRQADGSVKVLAGPNTASRKKHTCQRRVVVQRRV